jgi:quercetin dioxygenase-like cupin family protein
MCRFTTEFDSRHAAFSSGRLNSLLTPAFILVVAAGLSVTLPASSLAQDDALPAGFETQSLLKATVTRDNQPIAYPTGKPEIISVIGTIEPGGRTPLHLHPVPAYVYILEGELELRSEGGEPHRYKAGEAYIEALNQNHQLFNVGGAPARVLVVFVGEEGSPTTVAAK